MSRSRRAADLSGGKSIRATGYESRNRAKWRWGWHPGTWQVTGDASANALASRAKDQVGAWSDGFEGGTSKQCQTRLAQIIGTATKEAADFIRGCAIYKADTQVSVASYEYGEVALL
jgi:hypothetical protein